VHARGPVAGTPETEHAGERRWTRGVAGDPHTKARQGTRVGGRRQQARPRKPMQARRLPNRAEPTGGETTRDGSGETAAASRLRLRPPHQGREPVRPAGRFEADDLTVGGSAGGAVTPGGRACGRGGRPRGPGPGFGTGTGAYPTRTRSVVRPRSHSCLTSTALPAASVALVLRAPGRVSRRRTSIETP